MPNSTDQHSWYYPADGERDYEDTFETFFEQLDDDVEIRDTDANRSNYDPKAGAKFVATDTEDVYIGDGSSWKHLVSTGKDPKFDSVNTEQQSIGNVYVVGPNDDLSSVLSNHAGEIIDLAGRTYTISSPLTPPDDTEIRNGTIKAADGITMDAIFYEEFGPLRTTFRNLTLDGNKSNGTSITALVWLENTAFCKYLNVDLLNFPNNGYYLNDRDLTVQIEGDGDIIQGGRINNFDNEGIVLDSNRDYMLIDDVTISEGKNGVAMRGAHNTTVHDCNIAEMSNVAVLDKGERNAVKSCKLNHNNQGLIVEFGQQAKMVNSEVHMYEDDAVVLDKCIDSHISGNSIGTVDTNVSTKDAIVLDANGGVCEKNTVRNNDCADYSSQDEVRYGVNEINGASGNTIRQNTCRGGSGFPTFNSSQVGTNET